MGGISALSSNYENNEVLNQLQENVGIKINWETMSDSLAEQVNIRITGGPVPPMPLWAWVSPTTTWPGMGRRHLPGPDSLPHRGHHAKPVCHPLEEHRKSRLPSPRRTVARSTACPPADG